MSQIQSTNGALDGIRVIDFSRIVAGPHCTMCLADLGADVIKVEDTGKGDDLRSHKPPHMKCDSPYFLSLNRNKRSISIDMGEAGGQAVIHDLRLDDGFRRRCTHLWFKIRCEKSSSVQVKGKNIF